MHKAEVMSRHRWAPRILRRPRALLPLGLCLLGGSAVAQQAENRLLVGPSPLIGYERESRELRYTLGIKYSTGKIYNPTIGKYDEVKLRSYVDEDPKARPVTDPRFIAPLITMRPGQTVRMTLRNQLPEELDCKKEDLNTPKCFNSTNLHTHGLWVSPAGNSDNVLLEINPGVDFQYEYNVPEDHPAGTYWYHPHVHGSTAIQVASGMAGALIIKGDRLPTFDPAGKLTRTGDIDTLLKWFEPGERDQGSYPEVLLFQQIPYACFNDGKINQDDKGRWICDDKQVGTVEDFDAQFGVDKNFNGKFQISGRRTSINGFIQPRISMKAGTVYKWRMIDTGVRESINLRIVRVNDSGKMPKPHEPMNIDAEVKFIKDHCTGPVVEQWEVAADGLTRGQIVKRETNHLQPGYRSDILFAFPEEGEYCLYDDQTTVSIASTNSDNKTQTEDPRLLGWVTVKGGQGFSGGSRKFILDRLLKAADKYTDRTVRTKVKADLQAGLLTTSFVPHPHIDDKELKGEVKKINLSVEPDKQTGKPRFQINGAPYSGRSEPDHTLVLGTAQEWELTTSGGNHPFHIHVNPFEITSITDAQGNTLDLEKDPTYANYVGMVGTWKDTLLVQSGVKITARSRYERYIGDFVLHCHILDHEDQGMMQKVRITLPKDKNKTEPMSEGHSAHQGGAKPISHGGHH